MDKETLNNELAKEYTVTLEDLNSEYRKVCEIIGMEKALALAKAFSGMPIYVPKVAAVMRTVKHRYIRKEFTGDNYKELARKYGYTVRWIRMIVAGRA